MVRISSGKDSKQSYGTPQYIFDYFDADFNYTLDAAASKSNAKCNHYFTEKTNGLVQSWNGERVWLNPPYNNVPIWIEKTIFEVTENGCQMVTMFLNHDSGSQWYSTIWNAPCSKRFDMLAHRVRFVGAKHSQSVPSVAIHFQLIDYVYRVFDLVNPIRSKK